MKQQQKGVKYLGMHGIGQASDMSDNVSELVKTWLSAQHVDVESDEYADVSWAVDELFDLAHDDPERLLAIIVEILSIDPSAKVIGAIGAGVLEELLVYHGSEYIDKLVQLSNSDVNFKACLEFSYIDKDDVSVDVYEKIAQIKNLAK